MFKSKLSSARPIQRELIATLAMFGLLITVGVVSRFALIDIPNFKPVAAIALFAAFYFRRFWAAAVLIVLVMALSNVGLASCPWPITAGVVAGLLVAAALGRSLQSTADDRWQVIATRTAAASLVMSLAFFTISNGAVWMTGSWYPPTLSGLYSCYAAGIPFLKYTLMGDALFTGILFGSHYAIAATATRSTQHGDVSFG